MKKSKKNTPLNSIRISIGEDHQKTGGHKGNIQVVTKVTRGGHASGMLIDRFHIQLKNNSDLSEISA